MKHEKLNKALFFVVLATMAISNGFLFLYGTFYNIHYEVFINFSDCLYLADYCFVIAYYLSIAFWAMCLAQSAISAGMWIKRKMKKEEEK